MKTIKVLMLVPNLHVSNGVASYAMNYFRLLQNERVEMDFALFKDMDSPYYKEITSSGRRYHIIPDLKHPIRHIEACNRILRDGDYDIVHDNTLLVSIPMMWIAKLRQVSVRMLHSHNSKLGETHYKEKRNKLFLPLLIAATTYFAACSDLAAKSMFGNKKYTFIPNVISSNQFKFSDTKRQEVRREMGVEDKFVIGTVGRAAYQKNPLFALDVIKEIVEGGTENIEYWWIGSGPLDEEIKIRINELNLGSYVRFMGSRDDVVELYHAMDVLLLPSLFEGLPVTGIEAQAMGLSCVISDTVTKELDYTKLVQYVSLRESPAAWAKAIVGCKNNPNKRRSYLEELNNSAFSDKTAGRRLYEIYKQAYEQKR